MAESRRLCIETSVQIERTIDFQKASNRQCWRVHLIRASAAMQSFAHAKKNGTLFAGLFYQDAAARRLGYRESQRFSVVCAPYD